MTVSSLRPRRIKVFNSGITPAKVSRRSGLSWGRRFCVAKSINDSRASRRLVPVRVGWGWLRWSSFRSAEVFTQGLLPAFDLQLPHILLGQLDPPADTDGHGHGQGQGVENP